MSFAAKSWNQPKCRSRELKLTPRHRPHNHPRSLWRLRRTPTLIRPNTDRPKTDRSNAQQQYRAQLFAQLNGTLATRDTPRGFSGYHQRFHVRPGRQPITDCRFPASRRSGGDSLFASRLASAGGRLRRIRASFQSTRRVGADGARRERRGGSGSISAVGYGNARPVAPAGAEQNRRVEVVIYGDRIGEKALWDHPYSLHSGS